MGAAELWIRVHDALNRLGDPEGAGQALAEANELLQNAQAKDADFLRAGVAMLQGDRLQTEGNVQLAVRAYESAVQGFEDSGKDRERAIALGRLARLKAQAGNVQEALRLHQEELQTYETLGDVRSRAVALGDIARLKAQAGDVQEALRLHQEELQTYETLGDVRSRAVTLGDIAQLKAQAGDLAGAREFQEERLEVNRRLGDQDGIAAAAFDLAKLDLAEKKTQDALPRLLESWKIVSQLGRVDAIGVVGKILGQILAVIGMKDEARQILTQSEAAFRKLGWEAQADEVKALMDGL